MKTKKKYKQKKVIGIATFQNVIKGKTFQNVIKGKIYKKNMSMLSKYVNAI